MSKKYYPESIIRCFKEQEKDIEFFKEILNSKLILISYDCDYNFEPCRKNGKKAHWALITGFLFPIKTKKDADSLFSDNFNGQRLLRLNNDLNEDKFSEIMKNFVLDDETCVICKHGKSKHSAIWSLNRLLESNRQLKYVDEGKCNQNEFVRPLDGDIQASLSSKALIFL